MTTEENSCYSRLVSIYIEHGADIILDLDSHIESHSAKNQEMAYNFYQELWHSFGYQVLRSQLDNLIETLQLENGWSVKQNAPGEIQFCFNGQLVKL